VRVTIVVVEKHRVLHKLCICGLVIQHAMRMRHIAICGLPRSTVFLHILSLTAQFSKNIIEHKMYIFIPSATFCLILRKSERGTIKMSRGLHGKYPLFFSDFN
jgi:hypothetical protein